MSTTRTFPTLDLVTVRTGILVSDRGMESIYDLCGHMLGESLMTHQLPAASRACESALDEQHPWLAGLDPPKGDLPALKAWCAALVEEVGAQMQVESIEDPPRKRHNALADLVQIAAGRPVVVVHVEAQP